MFFILVMVAVLYRYYAKQREAFNEVGANLRDDLSADALSLYNAAYGAGVRARAAYEELAPKADAFYSALLARIYSR